MSLTIQVYKTFYFFSRQKMPVINIEDLTEKDKLKMDVDQLKKEVTLERMMVNCCPLLSFICKGNLHW